MLLHYLWPCFLFIYFLVLNVQHLFASFVSLPCRADDVIILELLQEMMLLRLRTKLNPNKMMLKCSIKLRGDYYPQVQNNKEDPSHKGLIPSNNNVKILTITALIDMTYWHMTERECKLSVLRCL